MSIAGGFWIVVIAPDDFYWNNRISSGKYEHKLAYNVSGLILSVPTNQRRSIF